MIPDVQEILRLHDLGKLTKRQVLERLFELVEEHDVDAFVVSLPVVWSELFVRWARSEYDNDIRASEYIYPHAAEIPAEKVQAIEDIRAYLRKPSAPAPLRIVASESALRPVGWFQETGIDASPDVAALTALRGQRRRANTGDVVRYLRRGHLCRESSQPVRDLFDESVVAGTAALRTDGKYLWPDTLAHYVERYRIALPEDFEEHMRENAWLLPDHVEIGS